MGYWKNGHGGGWRWVAEKCGSRAGLIGRDFRVFILLVSASGIITPIIHSPAFGCSSSCLSTWVVTTYTVILCLTASLKKAPCFFFFYRHIIRSHCLRPWMVDEAVGDISSAKAYMMLLLPLAGKYATLPTPETPLQSCKPRKNVYMYGLLCATCLGYSGRCVYAQHFHQLKFERPSPSFQVGVK